MPKIPLELCIVCGQSVSPLTANNKPRKDMRFCSKACRDGWMKGDGVEVRFWESVDKNGPIHPTYGQCWVWRGCVRDDGYGLFGANYDSILAHRYSWKLAHGAGLEQLCVCHHCDNRRCVNPDHLFLGTRDDNNQDMEAKERQARGEGKPLSSKITEEIARSIKILYVPRDQRRGGASLGRRCGLSPKEVRNIANGIRWKHVKVEGQP